MSLVFGAVAVLWLLAIVAARRAFADPRQRLDPPAVSIEPHPLPAVDVVVPARNEEHNLGPLLESLLVQDHPPVSIVVVDDHSTDGTARVLDEIARKDPRVRRLAAPALADGWKGKPAALTAGTAATASPWILFVDADVRLAPENLRAALAEARAREWRGVSLWGAWVLPPGPARWLQCVIGSFVRGIHPLDQINDPAKTKAAFLNGQYLLVERGALDAIGGWAAVKGQVLEDVALARIAKEKEIRIGLLRAPLLMRVEPYRSVREVWDGYVKNFVDGARGVTPALAVAGATFLASVLPFLVVLAGVLRAMAQVARNGTTADPATAVLLAALDNPATTAAVIASIAAVAFRMSTAREFSHPRWEALLHPVANAMFVALVLDAVRRRVRGEAATWKGRPV